MEHIQVRTRRFLHSAFLFLFSLASIEGALTVTGYAQTFTTLFSFQKTIDGSPVAGVVFDTDGNMYGSGEDTLQDPVAGTIFKLDTSGTRTILARIGGEPLGTLLRDSQGNLYGTMRNGGSFHCGSVFKVDLAGAVTILYEFQCSPDGANPFAGLIHDSQGNFYGTTRDGGLFDQGTVFKLDRAGIESILYSFTGDTDGGTPYGGVVRDLAGNLYGTTFAGGAANFGTVYKLDTANQLHVLFTFTGFSTGVRPQGDLLLDEAGNLYGTTTGQTDPGDQGNVFKLDPAGKQTVLRQFQGGDGQIPTAGVVRDGKGNLYGTTNYGGSGHWGTVFMITASGTFKLLHAFSGPDGRHPYSKLALHGGSLYGTTDGGGVDDWGTVFRIDK